MSLASLRAKLNQISKKKADDTFTFDISEPKKWMKGNNPEDWLEYIQHVMEKVQFKNNMAKHQILSDLYEKAFQDINSVANKNNEAYARLFVSYARLKSTCMPEDAMMIFNQARAIVRRFAIVHIAAAQFELDNDNASKAKKILEKAQLFDAKPIEEIKLALQKLKEGERSIYVSPVKKTDNTDASRRKFPSGSDTSDELKPLLTDNLTSNMSISLPTSTRPCVTPAKLTEPDLPMKAPISALKINPLPSRVAPTTTADSSVHRQGLKTFRSTPLLNSERKRAMDVGLPMRIKKINMPFSSMTEGEEDMVIVEDVDSFKPLEQSINVSHAHTSGYLSMSQVSDFTIPMDTKPLDKQPPLIEVPEVEEKMMAAPVSVAPVPPIHPSVHTSLPKPTIADTVLPQATPRKDVPSTPLPSMKMLTVNGQQYGVIGVIGQGGSCKVYQVLDGNHKIKAVKCVTLDNANDMIVEGYKNEIKLLKRLQYCDKVIKMYDSEFCVDENKLYVVMEVGSEDLASFFRSRTKNKKPLSDNLIRFYWEVMLEAVQALHKEGIIHSDLKPANFLLVGGNLKLIDFGIAKALQQDKTSVILETQIGTLNYMSPEAIADSSGYTGTQEGKPKFKIGVKSDVWSLGCILYNMVYGRTPFQNLKRDFFKLQAIINPDFPIEFPEIPNKHLRDVMQRCLNRDPKLRPSIDDLLNHQYLRDNKDVEVKEDAVLNKKMEALISELANQYSLSPGGIRNIIQHVETKQDGDVPKSSVSSRVQHPQSSAQPLKPQGLAQQPKGLVMVNRTPLSSLNLQDFKPTNKSTSASQGLKQSRNPNGS